MENGIDTLKLHHDTLLKTLKETLPIADPEFNHVSLIAMQFGALSKILTKS